MTRNRTISTLVAMTIITAITLAFAGNAGASLIVPDDFRVGTDFSNATDLLNYDDMGNLSGDELNPWGFLRDTNGDHILNGNYRMWFLDEGIKPGIWDSGVTFIEGLQVIGMVGVHGDGYGTDYNVNLGKGLFANELPTDYPSTPDDADEGAVSDNEVISVLAHNLDNGNLYEAYFTAGETKYVDFFGNGQHDITITDTIIPEPASLSLLAAGATLLAARRRRRSC